MRAIRPTIIAALLSLAACQGANLDGPAPPGASAAALEGRVAGQPRACISTAINQQGRVLDGATIAYDSGAVIWVNRLAAACPGLSPYNTMLVEQGGSQLCRGDRVRGLEPGGTIPGPACNLQDWVPFRRR